MLRLLATFIFCLILSSNLLAETIKLSDEGTSQGYVNNIDCVGSGLACTRSNLVGTVTLSATAPTSAQYLVSVADATLTAEDVVTEGTAIDYTNGAGTGTFAWDSTEVEATTWGAGGNASNIWTFDLSGTDHTMTASSGLMSFSHDIAVLGDNIEATTETDRAVFMANGSTYAPEVIDLGTDTTGNYAAGDAEAGNVAADKVLESSLKAVDSAVDEECLTYETTTGDFEWQSCSAGDGDVGSVGDCTSGACFDGTQGTTLTFNNAGGDATIDYDGTSISFSKRIKTTANLLIGAGTDFGLASFDGSADEVQVGIQANATQTALILDIQESSGGTVFAVDESGALVYGRTSITIPDDGAGTNAAYTFTPTTSYAEFTCNDAQACDITMSETGAREGQIIIALCLGATNNFADTANVSELAGTFACADKDTITMIYDGTAWCERARSNN